MPETLILLGEKLTLFVTIPIAILMIVYVIIKR